MSITGYLLFILEFVTVLSLLLSVIGIFTQMNTFNSDSFAYIRDLGENWKSGPLTNVFSSATGCLTNQTFITNSWPGTIGVCRDIFGYKYRGCAKHAIVYPQLPAMPYIKWRNTALCARRLEKSYFDLFVSTNVGGCGTGQKSCGIIDTLKNKLCVNNEDQCPLNNIQVVPINSPLPSGNFTKIEMKDSNMILSYVENGNILNEFMVQENTPCVNPFYEHYDYPIFKPELSAYRGNCTEVNGTFYDTKVEVVDKYHFLSVYKENGIYYIMSGYPGYDSYTRFSSTKSNSHTIQKKLHRSPKWMF